MDDGGPDLQLMPMNPGVYRWWVDLTSESPDGVPVTLTPARVKASIRPSAPSAYDERKVSHVVEMRYHPGVTFETQLTFTDRGGAAHRLYVRGIQDVDAQQRDLVLLCEEVVTP